MKILNKILFYSFLLILIYIFDVNAKPHWKEIDGKWKYLRENDENDYFFNEWKKIDGSKYYFDYDGFMVTGFQEIDGEYFQFGNDGKFIKEITELEYMNHMANITADAAINPLGEVYLELQQTYADYINEINESLEIAAKKEEEKIYLMEMEKEEQTAMQKELDIDEYYDYIRQNDKKSKEINEVINNFKNKYIKSDMSDFQKEIAIIQYIIENNKYDWESLEKHEKGETTYSDDCYNAYGALVKGTSVCAGYADAFNRMCKECGIESKYINGKANGGNHAWNQVKINGKWYNVDVTWEDPKWNGSDDNGFGFSKLRNDYINLTNRELEKDHIWSGGESCYSNEYGPRTVSYYLSTGNVESNIDNDKVINAFINNFEFNDAKNGMVWTYYDYNEDLSGLSFSGTKFSDNSNSFDPFEDKEKIKEMIKTYYNDNKQIVPISFIKKPEDVFYLNDLANELSIKYYYTMKLDGTNIYFLCIKK